MKSSDLKLAYLMITTPIPNTYIGGVMVTDSRGLPLEFRYTEPIQPTKIQQILYGQVLSNYIKREVILETLLKSVESKFKCLLVQDEHLLNYPAKGYTIVRISETKSSPIGSVGQIQEISPTELMLQTSQEGSPLRIHLAKPLASPAKDTANSDEAEAPPSPQQNSAELLIEAGQSMDVHEPLKRIEKALEIICQETGITSAT